MRAPQSISFETPTFDTPTFDSAGTGESHSNHGHSHGDSLLSGLMGGSSDSGPDRTTSAVLSGASMLLNIYNKFSKVTMSNPPTKHFSSTDLDDEVRQISSAQQSGEIYKRDEVDNPEKLGDIFFHTVFGIKEGVVRAVEEYGADVNAEDEYGFSPIHYACRRPSKKIAEYLLQSGASPNAISNNRSASSPLFLAIEGGDLEVIHLLVQHGANVDLADENGVTPLQLAIQKSRRLVCAFLIFNNANLSLVDKDGHTPLHWAAWKKADRVVELLLKNGADPLAADAAGLLPIHWAAVGGSTRCIDLLLEVAPQAINMKTKAGNTPAELADKNSQPQAAVYLRSKGKVTDSVTVLGTLNAMIFGEARLFMWALVYVPILLTTIAYFPRWVIFFVSIGLIAATSLLFKGKPLSSRNAIMMGTFIWSHFWSNIIYFARIFPYTYHLWWFHMPFFVLNIMVYEWYRQLAFGDPGYIEASRTEIVQMIEDLKSGRSLDRYCSTCWIRKPYRAKHCAECGKCVLRFDHHCPFTGNCIGAGNLWLFYMNHSMYVIGELGWYWLNYQFGLVLGYGDSTTSYWEMFKLLRDNEPWMYAMLCWHLFHYFWMIPLWFQQTYQVLTNLTTNEIWNAKRYDYLKDPDTGSFFNPYDQGMVENIKEVFLLKPKDIYLKTKDFPIFEKPGSYSILPVVNESFTEKEL